MNRRPARLLALAAVFTALTAGSATVIARADDDRCHGTSYTLEGHNYKVEVPQLSGCTTQSRQEFNDSLRLAADDFIARVDNTTSVHTYNANSMYIGAHIVSAKLAVEIYLEGAPHPSTDFITHNTVIASGKPLTLPDLFTNLPEGLALLSQQSKLLLDQTPRATGYTPSAITPTPENFRHWTATKPGLRLHFGEIASHAAGNIEITIPWQTLKPALEPNIHTILSAP
ncbi:RsiV family protein [Nocardia sp. NPDC050406]|uniref:RsiV family protein n=1 Tax=Nocardia sp. NPDC050406 TaxID=3364318 RepID=UPI0037B06B23